MCSNTKQKIALSLKQLMSERPLSKITVQDLMESAQMKRQSFYYHFQDIYDVLAWICERQLGAPLRDDPEPDFETWCIRLITLMDEDRAFYRRVLLAGSPEIVRDFCEGLTRPRVSRQGPQQLLRGAVLLPEAPGLGGGALLPGRAAGGAAPRGGTVRPGPGGLRISSP